EEMLAPKCLVSCDGVSWPLSPTVAFLDRPRSLLRLVFASGRVDAFGLGSVLGDDLPALSRLAHGAEIAGRVADLQVRGRDRLAGLCPRAHGRLQDAGHQQRALDRVGGATVDEVMLDRVGQRLEQATVLPRADM